MGGMIMGIMDNVEFKVGKFVLRPGELLFLYTDGVTEAMDKRQQQYGEDRLKKTILGSLSNPARCLHHQSIPGHHPSRWSARCETVNLPA
jgi:serine phosphatase RsbU (regulator of sigma subunit)